MLNRIFAIVFAMALIATFFMNVDVAKAQFVEDGLVGYWSFDDITDGTVKDAVGGHDGTIALGELPAVEGKVGNALEYDGDGARVEIADPDAFVCNADFTWSAWIKTEANGGVIMSKTSPEEGSDVQGAKTFFVDAGMLTFDTGWVGVTGGNITVNDNEWHYVAVTVEFNGDDTIQFYVDEEPDAQGQFNVNEFPEDGFPVLIGADPRVPGEALSVPFTGIIDEVAIYNRVLTEDEIKQNFNAEGLTTVTAVESAGKLAVTWASIRASR